MNRPDNWLDRYIGLPWKIGGRELHGGIDCWGLVRLVMRDEAGIDSRHGLMTPTPTERHAVPGRGRSIGILITFSVCLRVKNSFLTS